MSMPAFMHWITHPFHRMSADPIMLASKVEMDFGDLKRLSCKAFVDPSLVLARSPGQVSQHIDHKTDPSGKEQGQQRGERQRLIHQVEDRQHGNRRQDDGQENSTQQFAETNPDGAQDVGLNEPKNDDDGGNQRTQRNTDQARERS